jgi:hypothetical protein
MVDIASMIRGDGFRLGALSLLALTIVTMAVAASRLLGW